MAKEDGGPAFPTPESGQPGSYQNYGMSLRDWFAGQIAAALCIERDSASIADRAYELADAMLAERNRNSAAPKTAE